MDYNVFIAFAGGLGIGIMISFLEMHRQSTKTSPKLLCSKCDGKNIIKLDIYPPIYRCMDCKNEWCI